jgi:nucleoid-associated protein YgaU
MTMIGRTSRYYGIDTATVSVDGQDVAYLRRRFVPRPEDLALRNWHVVGQGERLDRLAAAEYDDPEQYYQVADANRALRPDDVMEVGRRLRIPLPAGTPGARGA